jgi:hypothetical protein
MNKHLQLALFAIVTMGCGHEPAPEPPLPGGPHGLSVVGFDASNKERAVAAFAEMTGRELEDARGAVEESASVGQILGLALTREEADWLEAWLVERGLEVQVTTAQDSGPGKRSRARGIGLPPGMREAFPED